MRWHRIRNIQRVQGIRDNNGGRKESTIGPRNLQRQWRIQWRNMSTKITTTTTTEALAENRPRVQGIGDDDGGGSGLTTGLVDSQRQRSLHFPCYRIANSNTVSSLSRCCLVLYYFHQIPLFLFTARNTISTAIMRKTFLHQVYPNLVYVPPTYRRVKNYEF